MSKTKKNFYAVRKGRNVGIYNSWDECNKQVSGFRGAEYKGFKTKHQAEEYLNQGDANKCDENSSDITIYVDGSYDADTGVYGYGFVAIHNDGRIEKFFGAGDNKDSALLRNVAGEMLAAMYAVKYAMKNKLSSVLICYDYSGIELWVNGSWKANSDLTIKYTNAMRNWSKEIDVRFKKIEAHTGEEFNEMADRLARHAVDNFVGR